MTLVLETIVGEQIDAGFTSIDVTRIKVGELAPIPLHKFVGWAAISLYKGIIPKLHPSQRTEWARDMHQLREELDLEPTDTSAQDKIIAKEQLMLPAGSDSTQTLVAQSSEHTMNPFIVSENGDLVAFFEPAEGIKHVVTSETFFNFTYHILSGGTFGWGERGTLPAVKAAAHIIDAALNAS